MSKFIIRVQRTTVLPDGVETDLQVPFAHRIWEIFEMSGPEGPAEYYGFGWTAEGAWDTVKDVLRNRARRHALTPRGVAEFMGLDSDALTELPTRTDHTDFTIPFKPHVIDIALAEPMEQPC